MGLFNELDKLDEKMERHRKTLRGIGMEEDKINEFLVRAREAILTVGTETKPWWVQ